MAFVYIVYDFQLKPRFKVRARLEDTCSIFVWDMHSDRAFERTGLSLEAFNAISEFVAENDHAYVLNMLEQRFHNPIAA